MSAFAKITATETKLFLRTPMWAGFGLLLPATVLLVCGFIPGMSQPSAITGGYRFIDLFAPSMIVIAINLLSLQSIPAAIASYREQGVLRRYSTTPVHPAKILAAQLLIHAVIAVLGVAGVLAVGSTVFAIPLPHHPLMFLLTLLLGITSMFGFGLIAAALARTAKAAGALAMILFFPTMFLGGVYLPRPLLPHVLQVIGQYLPPGVQPLQDSWVGNGPQPVQLLVLAGFAVVSTAVASRIFRWE